MASVTASYEVSIIHEFRSIEKCPGTTFDILEHRINENVLEIFIEHHSRGDPHIEAYWDNKNYKLYLVGGGEDFTYEIEPLIGVDLIVHRVKNRAWATINLSLLEHPGEVWVYKIVPPVFEMVLSLRDPDGPPAHEEFLMKIRV